MAAATWTIDSISRFVSASTKLELNLHELDELMQSISSQDRLMRSFAANSANLEPKTLLEFAEITVSSNRMAVQGMLDRIHLLVAGSKDFEQLGNTGTFRMIDESLQVKSNHHLNTYKRAGNYHRLIERRRIRNVLVDCLRAHRKIPSRNCGIHLNHKDVQEQLAGH